MYARQDADNLAWDQSDERWEKALKHVRASATCRKVEAFAGRAFGKPATLVTPLIIGGFNAVYPFKIEGLESQVLVRLPCPDQAMFPEEKTMAEVATAACIKQHTQVPIPKIFHHGIDEQIGPYMIIEDLGTRRGMSHALEAPRDDPNDVPILNPKISETQLKYLYSKMVECVLQLARPTFPRIGSLVESSPGTYEVLGRPISLNMNNMFQLYNVPSSLFPAEGTTYSTADEWYTVLAEMHMSTLVFQHNDMISSENDCRTKYIARKLFHRLAKQNRLTKFGFSDDDWSASSEQSNATLPSPDNSGSFRPWSDDFRPVNVLINDDNDVVGAIDWEFPYVGPSQFTLDPPWWLLLEVPEMWDDGIEDWASTYEQRLETWLSAMEEVEKENSSDLPLSAYMRESWATGRFWLNYAARKSWSFDAIYWKYLDERFFGKREQDTPVEELWKVRVELLTDAEREAMDVLVKTKVEESKVRVLVDWDAGKARQHLSAFLVT
ncbi:phosphotransferase [Fusarium proliferatum]|nr:phosphotransferase [Fusarium proliferatum]KAG4268050.1 phosphotransferase [Fusarium proliferatum]